ncbi:MAG: DUF255 domain-containing protein [Saprospiraceae bacterium]|nr:DUF255 domain-containing protein [Saprospiraceae bacterium]
MANLLYAQSEKINWISWEQAQEQLKTNKKKIFVDVVTDRCHWCKQMDNTTFLNSKIIKYINSQLLRNKIQCSAISNYTIQR